MNAALLGLILLALCEVPQVMSAWLPSPATAAVSAGDAKKRKWLTIGQWGGSIMSLVIGLGISIVAYRDIGHQAWLIFGGVVLVLGIFLYFWRMAMKEGEETGASEDGLGY
jgi:hypothetical protein